MDVDNVSISDSGIIVVVDCSSNASDAAAPSPLPAVYAGNVSINALNTNGVAMVTPLPANMSAIEATTRFLICSAST